MLALEQLSLYSFLVEPDAIVCSLRYTYISYCLKTWHDYEVQPVIEYALATHQDT
jgi:hypothetical protein